MKVCVAIVFEYSESLYLEGARQDLNVITKYAQERNYDLIIITDIQNASLDITYLETMLHGITSEQCCFYFSGHCQHGEIILPSKETIALHYLLESYFHECREIVMILDCCFPPTLELPFQQSDENVSLKFCDPCNNLPVDLLVIASSQEQEETMSSNHGSPFTYLFFKWCHQRVLSTIMTLLNPYLQPVIRSNDVTFTELPEWF